MQHCVERYSPSIKSSEIFLVKSVLPGRTKPRSPVTVEVGFYAGSSQKAQGAESVFKTS
jgi:hypothetical protein